MVICSKCAATAEGGQFCSRCGGASYVLAEQQLPEGVRVPPPLPHNQEGNQFIESRISVPMRLFYGFGISVLWVGLLFWIPIVGWFLLLFTPLVFFFPLATMKSRKRGTCPYCSAKVSHDWSHKNSFKCPVCRQTVIVSGLTFARP